MKEPFQNPLRRSLADSTPSGPHPDAGLLTAFAEGVLTKRERESVLSHLATCVECREILGVASEAAPQVEVAKPQLVVKPVRPPLRSWLPWVSTAAGIVVVSSAVLLHELPRKGTIETQPSSNAAHETAKSNEIQTQADEKRAETVAGSKDLNDRQKADDEFAANSQSSRDVRDKAASAAPAATAPAPIQAKKEKPAQATEQVTVESQAAAVQTSAQISPSPQRPGLGNSAQVQQNTTQDQPSQRDSYSQNRNQGAVASAKISQAAPPVRSGEMQNNVAVEAVPAPAFAPAAPAMRKASRIGADVDSLARPHWRIDYNGKLQRSFGGEWQGVLEREAARFRVVSVMGREVWAGGDYSRLYHSADNGSTWTPILLPKKNGTVHNLTRIHFQTPQTGTITSEDGATWVTTDGGKSWK